MDQVELTPTVYLPYCLQRCHFSPQCYLSECIKYLLFVQPEIVIFCVIGAVHVPLFSHFSLFTTVAQDT